MGWAVRAASRHTLDRSPFALDLPFVLSGSPLLHPPPHSTETEKRHGAGRGNWGTNEDGKE